MVELQAAPQMAEVPPDGYKVTELGLLPREWVVTSLGQLADGGVLTIQNGFAEGGHNSAGNGVPHLRPFNVTANGGIDLTQIKYVPCPDASSVYWVRKGDVIFNNTNSEELVGKTAYFTRDGEFLLSNHMTLIRVTPNQPLDAYWLANMLQHCYQTGVMHAASRRYVNQAAVTLTRLKGIKIPLPPLPEQRAIAHVLRTVQRAREATEKVIAATRELKKSLMRHLFTYGPVPVGQVDQVRLKETEIGRLPKECDIAPLDKIARITMGQSPPSSTYNDAGNGLPFLQGKAEFGDLYPTPIKWCSSPAKIANPGVVLVSVRAPVGDVNVAPVQCCIGRGLAAIEGAGVQNNFLFYWLKFSKGLLEAKGTGTTFKSINRDALASFPVPLLPLPEQREIAHTLTSVDKKIETEEKRKAALQALFKTMLHLLMTGKVRVMESSPA